MSLRIESVALALLASVGIAGAAPSKPAANSALTPALAAAPKAPKVAFGALQITAQPDALVEDNLRAAAVLYAAAALEEMKLFEVVDRVVDRFQAGKLPVGAGAKSKLVAYAKAQPERLDANSRRRIYGHVLGGTQSGATQANDDFAPLLARLLDAVSQFERASALAKGEKKPPSATAVHAAARDLATNLSNHGYGAAVVSAALLADQLRDGQALLSHPDVLEAYGAKDMWQVVERVAQQELKVKVNVTRARTRAEAGSAVLTWLAEVRAPLASSGGAAQVEQSLAKSRVPESARDLSRVVSPKTKVVTQSSAQAVGKVRALCFDAKRNLVACKVQSK